MSGLNYTPPTEDEDERDIELATRHIAPRRRTRTTIDLDPIEIRGRVPPRESDTPEDVAESIARKGEPMREAPSELSYWLNPLDERAGRDFVRGIRGAHAGVTRTASDLARTLDEATGISRLANRARDVPVVGSALDSWLSSGTAGTTGLASGLTSGFGDEIAGAGAASLAALAGEDTEEAYESTRDARREEYARARRESPYMTGLGELAGGVAQGAVLPSMPRAPGLLGSVGSGMAEGLALGAVSGAGHSDEDTVEGVIGDTIEGGLTGGAFGAAGGAIGYGIGQGVDAARRYANRADDLRIGATVGTGRAPLSTRAEEDIARLPGGTRAAADYARRRVPRLGTVETAARALEEGVEDSGRRLGEYTRRIDEALPDMPVETFTDALGRVSDDLGTNPGTVGLTDRPLRMADDWRTAAANDAAARARATLAENVGAGRPALAAPTSGPSLDPTRIRGETAREGMSTIRNGVNFAASTGGPSAASADLDAYRALRRAYDEAAEAALPGSAEAYRALRNEHAIGSTLERYARPAAMRAARSPGAGLRGTMMGAGALGGGASAPVAAAVAEGAGWLARRRPAAEATAAETVRAILESGSARVLGDYGPVLTQALRRGADEFLAFHAALMGSDPEYRATVEAASEADPMDAIEWDDETGGADASRDSDDDPMSRIEWE